MDFSIFVARFTGIAYIAMTISLIIGTFDYDKMFKSMEDNYAYNYLAAFIALLLGFTFVTYHNLWVKDWRVVITIMGWVALAEGAIFIIFPDAMSKSKFFKNRYKKIIPYLVPVLAIFFTYFGFFA